MNMLGLLGFATLGTIGVILLGWMIHRLLLSMDRAIVTRLPVAPKQTFSLPRGRYQLCIEGRLLSFDFIGFQCRMRYVDGTEVPLRFMVFRNKVNSFTRGRVSIRSFSIDRERPLQLDTSGMSATADPNNRIVIQRPLGFTIVIGVLGLILAAAMALGGLIGVVQMMASGTDQRTERPPVRAQVGGHERSASALRSTV